MSLKPNAHVIELQRAEPPPMPTSLLLVESQGDVLTRISAGLRALDEDWTVEVASTVASASRLLSVGVFDVVLCAHWLPDGSAFDVLPHVRQAAMVIAVQPGNEIAAADAMRAGCFDYIVLDAACAYQSALPQKLRRACQLAQTTQSALAAAAVIAKQLGLTTIAVKLFDDCLAGVPQANALGEMLDGVLRVAQVDYGFVLEPGGSAPGASAAPFLHTVAAVDVHGQPQAVRIAQDDMGEVAALLATLIGDSIFTADSQFRLIDLHASPAAKALRALGHPVPSSLAVWPTAIEGNSTALIALGPFPDASSSTDILATILPLTQTIARACAHWRYAARIGMDGQDQRVALQEFQQRNDLLQDAVDHAPCGIILIDADGRVPLYNDRYCELVNIPAPLMAQAPRFEDVVRLQLERGDFGDDLSLLDSSAREAMLQAEGEDALPTTYSRRTRSGRVLQVQTYNLASGNRLRTFIDCTETALAQEGLRQNNARWNNLTEISSDWYWEQDADYRFVRISGHRSRSSGVMDGSSLGKTRWELPATGMTEQQWHDHQAVLASRAPFVDFEMQRLGPDGRQYWVSISGAPVFDAAGNYCGYSGVGRDITDRKRAEAEIERLAFYDALTKLPNRRLLLDRLSRAVVNSARKRRHGALLFLDLDNFKDLNDTLGHEWGDRLLQQVAERILLCVRAGDTVARIGGDEFVVVLEELHEVGPEAAAEAEAVGQKILAALNKHYSIAGSDLHSTPSIGITVFNDKQQTVEELLKRADLAMYQAKAGGRNTLCFFDPDMQAAVTARSALESDLRHGLARNEFIVYYQPVVDFEGGLLGVEALVRWNHPQRGMVSPAHFIPLAEQTGLILELGRKVLEVSCTQLVAWARAPETAHLTVAVNVSARQFRHPDFVQHVLAVVNATGVDPRRLKLELTESLLLNDVEDIIGKMNALRTLGIGFSLDDFGTGYSSLSYLKRLPLDQLKIDQSFVRDVLTDPNDAAIACTIVALAHSLGLAVVAEGVETAGQFEFLIRNGCQCFQGYLFGRPVPIEVLQAVTAAGRVELPV